MSIPYVKKPCKTDFARWLDAHGSDLTELNSRWIVYSVRCDEGGRIDKTHFGFWLKENHPKDFNRLYTELFLKNPELMETVYGEENPPIPPADIR